MKRLVIYFHYDPAGCIDTACRIAVQAVQKLHGAELLEYIAPQPLLCIGAPSPLPPAALAAPRRHMPGRMPLRPAFHPPFIIVINATPTIVSEKNSAVTAAMHRTASVRQANSA